MNIQEYVVSFSRLLSKQPRGDPSKVTLPWMTFHLSMVSHCPSQILPRATVYYLPFQVNASKSSKPLSECWIQLVLTHFWRTLANLGLGFIICRRRKPLALKLLLDQPFFLPFSAIYFISKAFYHHLVNATL